jgi:DNA (cytosine-5)-methyltransferase 1
MSKFRVLDLFSGVGAYSLGLERTGGFRTVAFCEIEEYPRKILRKHWPDVPIFNDVRALNADTLARDGIDVDVIIAGWPCQDISPAGTGYGLDGARSGLWAEIARLAGELRPRMLVLENSANLLAINNGRDFGRVLGDLASLGFDAEWHCLPAAAFDAPHYRDRLWIVANAKSQRWRKGDKDASGSGARICSREKCGPWDDCGALADTDCLAPIGAAITRQERNSWLPEPGMDRVVTGCPNRVDRIRALGNLNPPVIPETLGRAILAAQEPTP